MRRRKFGIEILALRARISIPNFHVFYFWTWGPPPDPREKKPANKKTKKNRETNAKEKTRKKCEKDVSRHETAHLRGPTAENSKVEHSEWPKSEKAIQAGRRESTHRFTSADVNRHIDSRRPAYIDAAIPSADLNQWRFKSADVNRRMDSSRPT